MHFRLAFCCWHSPPTLNDYPPALSIKQMSDTLHCLFMNAQLLLRSFMCALQLSPLYLAAMDAIYAVSPTTIFMVEGTGQQGYPGINWGDGFVTDSALIRQYGLSDPNSFFQTLAAKPYLNNVGISPHVYPPSVTYATTVSPMLHCRLTCRLELSSAQHGRM